MSAVKSEFLRLYGGASGARKQGLWPYAPAPKAEKIKAALKMAGDEQHRNNVMDVIGAGHRDEKVNPLQFMLANFHFRSMMETPFLFRDLLAKGGNAFMKGIEEGAVLAFNSPSDLPELVTRNYSVFRRFEEYDTQCFQAFRNEPWTPGQTQLEIAELDSDIRMHRRKPGQQVELSKFTGDFKRFTPVDYAGGVQWDKYIRDERPLAGSIEVGLLLAEAALAQQCEDSYATIVAAGLVAANNAGNPKPFITTGANAFENSILSFNGAFETLADQLKGLVGIDRANARFLLYFNGTDSNQAQAAKFLRYSEVVAGVSDETISARPITPIPTYNLVNPNTGLPLAPNAAVLVYPGRENVYSDRRTPTNVQGEDIFTLSRAEVLDMSFVVGTGNTDQFLCFEWKA